MTLYEWHHRGWAASAGRKAPDGEELAEIGLRP
jgi:hypothetical protein